MAAAIKLAELTRQGTPVTSQQLVELYKLTYEEAFKEGMKEQRFTCGCSAGEDENA